MKHLKKNYNGVDERPVDLLRKKHKIAMSIMVPFLQIFDTFQAMDKVLNVTNKNADSTWLLEKHYNSINALFLVCQIKDYKHKDELFELIYFTAFNRVGDKDFKGRAKEILALMKMRLKRLAKSK